MADTYAPFEPSFEHAQADYAAASAWCLRQLNVVECHESGFTGKGVVILHPDSGSREHPAFNWSRVHQGPDFYNADDDPTFAGRDAIHGLKTGSVIIGSSQTAPEGSRLIGVAPDATLVEVQVTRAKISRWNPIPTPVLMLNTCQYLTDAINLAVERNIPVISISLGTKFFNLFTGLKRACERAYKSGIIVVAAGGNYTKRLDIYPAAYATVISCGATGPTGEVWVDCGSGSHIEFMAPGEGVYRAAVNRDTNTDVLSNDSQGTSYAVAHIAGIAALWLERHGGHDALLERIASLGLKKKDLVRGFRQSLALSVQRAYEPEGDYGYGLVNAHEALKHDPFEEWL